MTKIISGSASKELAKSLSFTLGMEEIPAIISRYQDQELKVQLGQSPSDTVIIVQSTSRPANDHLMELLLLVDAAKRSGAKQVIACVPYFGYSRQDRPSPEMEHISARLVARMLEAAGVDHLVTLDLHSPQIEGFFEIGVQNLEASVLFAPLYKNRPNLMVVSPDIGGTIRAQKLSGLLETDLAIINKVRKGPNACEMAGVISNVEGFDCLIIDDIIDTGQTLCKAAEILMARGALSVEVVASHPVLSGNALENIEKSPIKKITVTNSIGQPNLPKKFDVVDITPLLADSLKRFITRLPRH